MTNDNDSISGCISSLKRLLLHSIQLLHFIECDMMCYGALKSNVAFQCSIAHYIAQNEVL